MRISAIKRYPALDSKNIIVQDCAAMLAIAEFLLVFSIDGLTNVL